MAECYEVMLLEIILRSCLAVVSKLSGTAEPPTSCSTTRQDQMVSEFRTSRRVRKVPAAEGDPRPVALAVLEALPCRGSRLDAGYPSSEGPGAVSRAKRLELFAQCLLPSVVIGPSGSSIHEPCGGQRKRPGCRFSVRARGPARLI